MKSFTTLAAASVLALSGAAAWAQSAPAPAPSQSQQGTQQRARAPQMSRADMEALSNARIAGIQAGLKLNADQQKLFAPVEQALRAASAARMDRFEAWRQERATRTTGGERRDFSDMLSKQADFASKNAQALTNLANAVKPFYASLDDSQKRLLPILMRPDRGQRSRLAAHHRGQHMRGPVQTPAPQQ